MIGSAACALHGVDTDVADIDVLVSPAAAAILCARLGERPFTPADDPRFRSTLFARWTQTPLPVEIMAGLHVRRAGGWTPVTARNLVGHRVAGETIWAPDRDAMIAMLLAFGRAKDLRRRAALLAGPPG